MSIPFTWDPAETLIEEMLIARSVRLADNRRRCVATPEFVARAHADGYAVHVWFSGTAPEDEATYNELIDACVDGLMTSWPTLLERILDERGVARPGSPGSDRCADAQT